MSTETSKSQKPIIRKTISIVLSFFLFVCIVLLSILYLATSTILSNDFFKKQVSQSLYAENLLSELEPVFISYGVVSGFDANFFKEAITLDMITNDINLEVDKLYLGNKITSSNDLKKHIYDLAIANVKARSIDIFDEQGNIADETINNSILYFAETCSDTYYKAIKFPASESIYSVIQQANKIIQLAFSLMIVFIVIFIILIFIINNSLKDKLTYYIYALSSSVIVLIIPIIFSFYDKSISNIAINNKALYYLVVTYFNSTVNVLKSISFVTSLVLITLIIARLFISRTTKKANPN